MPERGLRDLGRQKNGEQQQKGKESGRVSHLFLPRTSDFQAKMSIAKKTPAIKYALLLEELQHQNKKAVTRNFR
ncbi:MAG TPA: hypothetical protein PKV71_15320 [Calditrichia bacterium]|nr:hypothetical protein [Calditrichia bacterium]